MRKLFYKPHVWLCICTSHLDCLRLWLFFPLASQNRHVGLKALCIDVQHTPGGSSIWRSLHGRSVEAGDLMYQGKIKDSHLLCLHKGQMGLRGLLARILTPRCYLYMSIYAKVAGHNPLSLFYHTIVGCIGCRRSWSKFLSAKRLSCLSCLSMHLDRIYDCGSDAVLGSSHTNTQVKHLSYVIGRQHPVFL